MAGLPSGRLAAALVRLRLLRFLAEAGGAVGVLLAHGLAVGQVLGAVDDGHEGADLRAVDGHVRVDAIGVRRAGELSKRGRHGVGCSTKDRLWRGIFINGGSQHSESGVLGVAGRRERKESVGGSAGPVLAVLANGGLTWGGRARHRPSSGLCCGGHSRMSDTAGRVEFWAIFCRCSRSVFLMWASRRAGICGCGKAGGW